MRVVGPPSPVAVAYELYEMHSGPGAVSLSPTWLGESLLKGLLTTPHKGLIQGDKTDDGRSRSHFTSHDEMKGAHAIDDA